MASCASSAAAAAETSGSRSPKACRRATATSTCCATPWPSIRSISAACISAPPAGRCTPRPMPETAGRPSCAIFRPCFPSRCRRCAMIRVVLPQHLRTLARVDGEVELEVGARSRSARCSTRSRRAIRCCAARSATTSRSSAGLSCVSSPARKICPTSRRTRRCPSRRVRRGAVYRHRCHCRRLAPRKNSDSSGSWEGHDFSRADKSLKMVCALAPEVCSLHPLRSAGTGEVARPQRERAA